MRRASVGLIVGLSWGLTLGLSWALGVGCASDKRMPRGVGRVTTAADRVARARDLVEAFNRHDVARSLEHLATTVTWNRGDGTSLSGRDTLAAHLKGLLAAFPDVSLSTTRIHAVEPNAVVVEWTLTGTHLGEWRSPGLSRPMPPTGRPVRVAGADLFWFGATGEIESDEARIDVAALWAELSGPAVPTPEPARLRDFARAYTAAWKSQNAASVAAFYAPNGSLTINGGTPAVGRTAIAAAAQAFMSAFPDLDLLMDGLLVQGDRAVYRWTFLGTNTGPGGTGARVRFSGFEVWRIGADGLVAESRGYFDSAAYQAQLEHGIKTPR